MCEKTHSIRWITSDFHMLILVGTAAIFLGLEIYAVAIDSHYRYDIPICLFLLYMGYKWKELLCLKSYDYVLIAVFLLVHTLGVFGLYTSYPLGIEYDYWVHGLFGIVAALVSMQFIHSVTPYSQTIAAISTIILVMGIAAFHELYEFAGAVLLGEGEGVLFIGAGDLDQWDTHKDILNNLIGGLVGIGVSNFRQKSSFSSKS